MVSNIFAIVILLLTYFKALVGAEYIYSVFEEGSTPREWIKRGRVHPDTRITIDIALVQRNLDKGEKFVLDVSDPQSHSYGDFWTVDQVIDMFSPSEESYSTVRHWLLASGIEQSGIIRSEDRGWLSFQIAASEAEALFRAKYYHFSHRKGATSIASDSVSLPDSLANHIDFVRPGGAPYAFARISREKPASEPEDTKNVLEDDYAPCKNTNLKCCDRLITPGCIRALYNLPEPKSPQPKPEKGNQFGLFEAGINDTISDLNKFFDTFAKYIPRDTHPGHIPADIRRIDLEPTSESALDFDVSYPIVYPQIIQALEYFDAPEKFFANKTKIPNVFSSSLYAIVEDGPGKLQKISERQCNGYMKLALLGTSVFQASGDFGVGCGIKSNGTFNAVFPATCPYVTAVGATEVPRNSSVYAPEKAAHQAKYSYTSGGGFSQYFRAPSYQAKALSTYFDQHDPGIPHYYGLKNWNKTGTKKYNRLGRGFPDVAANGLNIATVFQGEYVKGGGTSSAAPMFASMINKIVEERLKAGKGPLGFLNPALYANPSMFHDIVEGFNQGCGYQHAFYAVKGWDPVTGLGTANYPAMLKYFMSLK